MSDIDEVRSRLDIVEIVGDYVQLKRGGRSFKGLCPFHDEKTPSFVVFPDSGNWRCFGACAIGGDAFDFVMRVENLDFRGALEHLAKRVGVVLEPPSPAAAEKKDRREQLRDVTAEAVEFFHQQLMRTAEAEPARTYLRERDFGTDTAQAFQMGWAPAGWSALADHLTAKGYEQALLLDAGLVKPRDSGGVYDSFRDRVVFPIHDAQGRAIGFGARTLDPEGLPKYLNSPQSPIFDKSHVLYGLHRAARAIRAEEQAVVVEGYTDVVRAHMAGFENVVASLGTAITEHQLRALKRYTRGIVLALDADAAGQAATLRGLEVAREAAAGGVVPVPTSGGRVRYAKRVDVELRVVSMPAGKDPDDVIRGGPANWRKLVNDARPVMDYLFAVQTEGLDLGSPEGKTTAADRLLPVLAELNDPVARGAWLARLAQMIRIDEQALGERLDDEIRQRRRRPRPARRRADQAAGSKRGPAAAPPASGPAPAPPATDRKASAPPGPGADAPPDWALSAVPVDAAAASDMPEDSEAGTSSASDEATPARDVGGQADGLSAQVDAGPSAPRAGSDSLVSWLLGHLLVDPARFGPLNKALRRDQQPPLSAADFGELFQRDLVVAVGYAATGVAPPDAPDEHRLNALPEPLAAYAAALRDRAIAQLATDEVALADEIRLCVLRLRKRELERNLPGLRYLMSEAEAEAQLDYLAKVAELTARINALTQLLSPHVDQQMGKIDPSVQ